MAFHCTTIDRRNMTKEIPKLKRALRVADVVAIDLEFSGLGRIGSELTVDDTSLSSHNWNSRAADMEERYRAYRNVAQTHSVFSLGISIFKRRTDGPTAEDSAANAFAALEVDAGLARWRDPPVDGDSNDADEPMAKPADLCYDVQNYTLFLYRADSFIVDPLSLCFLRDHGMDLGYLFQYGIPYYPGDHVYQVSSQQQSKKSKKSKNGHKNTTFPSSTKKSQRAIKSAIDPTGNPLVRSILTALASNRTAVLGLHNGLLDLVFLYHSFHAGLPAQLGTFLSDLDRMFPGGIYDTKYIADYIIREPRTFLSFIYYKWLLAKTRSPLETHGDSTTAPSSTPMRIEFPASAQPPQPSAEDNSADPVASPVREKDDSHSSGFDAYMTGFLLLRFLHDHRFQIPTEARNRLNVMYKKEPLLVTTSQFSPPSDVSGRKRSLSEIETDSAPLAISESG
ncbi:hypothetical protein H4R33_002366 [Dimargaris cristalligena]|nr:hypothetical protein H4R33_002366 [Dimargaris cristalligena]